MSLRKDLLIELLYKESYHPNEKGTIEIIKRELSEMGFSFNIDPAGNICAVRGKAKKYPLLNAHMDIVDITFSPFIYYSPFIPIDEETLAYDIIDCYGTDLLSAVVSCEHCESYHFCRKERIPKLCMYFEPTEIGVKKLHDWAMRYELLSDEEPDFTEEYRIVEKNGKIFGEGKERVLGGDDKCGVFLALEVARTTDIPMKLLFTVGEEMGCIGIQEFIKHSPEWFNNVKYSITIDRREGDNLLWSQQGVRSCSRQFASKLAMTGIKAGIPVKVMDGGIADVIHIRNLVKNAVNISAGYYNAHSSDEYIKWSDVVKIHKWVKRFVEEN